MRHLYDSATRDEITLLAAALAHFALLSLVPLLLLMASVAGVWLRGGIEAQQRATQLLRQFVPVPTTSVDHILRQLMAGGTHFGGWGLIILVWISGRTFAALQRALDTILRISPDTRRRAVHHQWLVAVLTMFSLAAFAALSQFGTDLLRQTLRRWHAGFAVGAAVNGLGVCLSVALMYLVYRTLPSAKVRARSALAGAVVSGLLWEAAKDVFGVYYQRYNAVDRIYGTMGGLVLIIVWSYFSALIVLVGAEVAKCFATDVVHGPVVENGPSTAGSA